jgi:hypothetical protein
MTATTTPAQTQETQKASRFTVVETERYMYNPNQSGEKTIPLVGYLLNMQVMPPLDGREWEAFLLKITEPTVVINREKEVVKVKAGSEVLIPATYQLTQFFAKVSTVPDKCYEVSINPKKKIQVGKAQTMWIYDLGINLNKEDVRPRASFGPAAMLGAPALPTVGQSTAEQAASGGVNGDPNQIPF